MLLIISIILWCICFMLLQPSKTQSPLMLDKDKNNFKYIQNKSGGGVPYLILFLVRLTKERLEMLLRKG